MCGLFGLVNTTGKYANDMWLLLPDFFMAGSIRGVDGIGMIKVDSNGKSDWLKSEEPGYDFLKQCKTKPFITGIGAYPFIVGHHRSATRGTISVDNTHPFEHKHITLVHNGTVTRTRELAAGTDTDVDSKMITYGIAERGLQETVNEMYGAWSMVWYDGNEAKLNFLRNDQRPMSFLTTKDGMVLFCSEELMGRWIAARRGVEIVKAEHTKVDHLYQFSLDSMIPEITKMAPVRKVYSYPPLTMKGTAKKEISKEERDKMMALFDSYQIGEQVPFSLDDFDEPKKKKKAPKFVFVKGDIPKVDGVVVQGNFGGEWEQLYVTKCLLSGKVSTKEWSKKRGAIVLTLKDIHITELPDPHYHENETPEGGQAPVGKSEGNETAKVIPMHQKEENKKVHLTSRCCQDCGNSFTRVGSDVPYLVRSNNMAKIVCVVCFMNSHSPNSLVQGAKA